MTSKKFRPRAPQQTGPSRNLRTMATPPSVAQNKKGAATDKSLTYVRAFRTDAEQQRLHNNRMLNNEYVSTNANLRSVLSSNGADRPNEEITISSKHALIKRMAWAMLRLLQERAEHQGMQNQFLRTEGPPNDASNSDR